MSTKLTKRKEDYSKWYNELVEMADLAEHSSVRGCMVIKPHGYAIWEVMQKELDKRFKATGHQNAYFPLFVPKSLFEAEEKNAEGFAKECAVVTHYRLKTDENDKSKLVVDETAKLEEELIVRPTSEAIIWSTYKKWIQSYRDLPILINQWANVVRWEMRTRLFLRTTEFLWQEGHTAHATREEALDETKKMLEVYAEFSENILAIPVIKGFKTESERFAGADETLCIEGLMQDGKALQMGTSHYLGQNFAKAFDVKYTTKEGKQEYVWSTSWGVSTRLMGALIMNHSDDQGLVLPPKLAPIQVVIVPIYKGEEQLNLVSEKVREIIEEIGQSYPGIRVKYDDRDSHKPGFKFAEWEMKGVPIRIAIGLRDLENNSVEIARRDTLSKQTLNLKEVNLAQYIHYELEKIQTELYAKALNRLKSNTYLVNNWSDFETQLDAGGFILAHWDGTAETELEIKNKTKATIRCIPFDSIVEEGNCILTGKPSKQRVLFARAY